MVGVVPRPVVDDHADEQPDDDQGARLWKMPEMNSLHCIQAELDQMAMHGAPDATYLDRIGV